VFCASNRSFQVGDNLTWVKGQHTIKGGFNYFRKAEKDFDYIRFVGFDTTATRAGTVDESLGGDSIASFLLGLPTYMQQRYSLTGGDDTLNMQMPYWGFYAEDKWQINNRWTFNFGLRYELNPPLYSGNRYGNAIVDMSVPDWQMAIPGRASGLDLHYLPADKTAFAPRVGVAFQPDDRWVIRANYGIFYDLGLSYDGSETGSTIDAAFGGVPGYVGSFYDSARFGEPEDVPVLTFDDIFPPADEFAVGTYPISTGEGTGYFDFPASINYLDQDSNQSPHYHRYVVSADRLLGQNMAISLFYSGSSGRDLPYYFNQNVPDYRTGWPSEDAFNEARPNASGRFSDVRVLRHGLNSTYNAGTVRIDRRLSRGLQLVAHYTYSKTTIDRIQLGDFSWNWHPELGRGEADFSHPHRFVVAGTWEVPTSGDLSGVTKALLADWTLSGIYTYESGDALTVMNGQSSARDFEPDMPNVTGDPNDGPHTVDQWFNVAAFSDPGFDVKGNARPGIVRAPPINNLDLSIAKTLRPGGVNVLFRVDMFNALNHPQWLEVDTDFSTAAGSTFGRINSARDGRIIQFGARVSF
jgi:outer membrane receptor protein involved in Fe transport